MLTTLANYRAVTGDASTSDASALAALAAADRAVKSWCQRDFVRQVRSGWFEPNGGHIFLPEWPVRSVHLAGGPASAITLANSTGLLPTIEVTATGITLSSWQSGDREETAIEWEDAKTLGDLKDAIEGDTTLDDWTVSLVAASDYPTALLKPVQGDASFGLTVEGLSLPPASTVLTGERTLSVGAIGNWAYVRWDGGYTEPDPDADPVVAGDVPEDLQAAVCLVAKEMLLAGRRSGDKQGETIGDYSYSVDTSLPDVGLGGVVGTQSAILSKYRVVGWE